jgi:DNA-binding transcriptional MocR family regulator
MEDDNGIRRVIQCLRGELAGQAPGSRLPSVRALMARHRVSPTTVQRAVGQLVIEGLIEAKPGRGTFVAMRPEAARAADLNWQSMALGPGRASAEALRDLLALPALDAIPLSTGYLPEPLQALAPLTAAMAQAMRRPGVWDRIPLEGLEPLRGWFARQIGNGFGPHEAIICPGSQAAIAGAFRALAAPGAAVLLESPTYIGAITAARAAGLRLIPVPTDEQGVHPDMLEQALAASGARVFYCQPTYANPSGAVLAPERRRAVMDRIVAAGAFLIEDDWARDLALDQPPPPPLVADDRNGHVVYIRSLTKPAAPGLRIGAILARGAALARLKATRSIDDFFVAGPLQETALQLVTSPAWPRHLRRLQGVLRDRRDGLVAAVREHFGADSPALVPSGGFHLWLRLPEAVSDIDVAIRAARVNLVVSPGRHWFPAEPPGSFLRLTYAGAPVEMLRRGVGVLAGIVG